MLLVLSPKLRRESNTSFSLTHIHLSKLVNLLTSALFFHSLHIVVLSFPLLSPLVALLCTSRLKIANRSYYHSAPVLWNNLLSHLRQVVHHIAPSPILNSPVSDLSTSLFLNIWKPLRFNLRFLLNLYSPRLSQDWYLRYWPSFVFLSHAYFAIIHRQWSVITYQRALRTKNS